METLQEEPINIEGGTIPVKLTKEEEEGRTLYSVTIDNVQFAKTTFPPMLK